MKGMTGTWIILVGVAIVLFAGCMGGNQSENIVFEALVEEVSAGAILVETVDFPEFDRASVQFGEDLQLDFVPEPGQRLEIEILPEVRESYPVQVTAVRIERIRRGG